MIDAARVSILVSTVQDHEQGPVVNAAVAELIAAFSSYVGSNHLRKRFRIDGDELDSIIGVSIWKAARLYDVSGKRGSFGTFAYTLTIRAVIDHMRRDASQTGRTAGFKRSHLFNEATDIRRAQGSVSDSLVAQDEAAAIAAILTDNERAVFVAFVNGQSFDQIAQTSSRSITSVRGAMDRIRKRVRERGMAAA